MARAQEQPAAASKPAASKPAAAAPAPTSTPPVALLFPGQGSQYVKMLDSVKDLPEVKDPPPPARLAPGVSVLRIVAAGGLSWMSSARITDRHEV